MPTAAGELRWATSTGDGAAMANHVRQKEPVHLGEGPSSKDFTVWLCLQCVGSVVYSSLFCLFVLPSLKNVKTIVGLWG